MPARLIEALATTGPLADLFSDESVLRAMLQFEIALARVEARLGVIPQSAAKAIAEAATPEAFDLAWLAQQTLRAGTPGIPLARALTEIARTKNAAAAGFVHWGATSQDVADTALVLMLKRAKPILIRDLAELETVLRNLSDKHKNTVMLGRTLLQAAPPITFGLKAAGWLSAIRRGRIKLDQAFTEALMLQFGGATGTLAALGRKGTVMARALAEELGLQCPEASWHTHRDRLASLMCACGVLTGSLGKMARDIALLSQNEVDEISEPGGNGRGGSSTMPHKRNPIGCALTLAAANRVPHLVASFLSAMPQEHERGVGGWQSEWPIVASVVQSTGLAIASMTEVAGGLSIHRTRMRKNLESTGGLVFAERAAMLLAPKIGRDSAHDLLASAAKEANSRGVRLKGVLADMPEVAAHLDPRTLRNLEAPEEYLGATEEFRKGLIARIPSQSRTRKSPKKFRRRKEA